MNFACFGDNCVDYYRETGRMYPGGNPVNVAACLRRLGERASYVGAVGNDRWGEFLLSALRDRGVDVSHVRVEEGSTAVSYVSVADGERVFTGFEEGVMAGYRPDEDDIDFICAHDLAVTGMWGHSESALGPIRARGIPTAYDASEDPFGALAAAALPHTALFFFSDAGSGEEELREKLKALAAGGPEIVVATRGSRGSIAYDGEDFVEEGIVPCRVVDTMGAGDSYIAGFLAAWTGKRPLRECMKAGAASAAVTLGSSGAWAAGRCPEPPGGARSHKTAASAVLQN